MKKPISDEEKAARAAYEIRQAFADTRRFCAESLSVEDMQGRLVPFVWNPAQEKLERAISQQRAKGLPVRIMILKSRRVGFSTGVAGVIFKETAFVDGQPALVVAHEKRAVKDSIFPMYDRFQKHYKPFMDVVKLPALITDTQEGLAWANRSSIDIQTANNLEGARSFNYRRVHLSEYAFYRNIRHFMTALIPTVPDDPDTLIIKESTANGYNEFYDEWQLAVEGKSSYLPIFFGCYDDPNNWKELTEEPEVFKRSLTNEEWELKNKYDLAPEQLNWRRHKLRDYKGDENLFNQEYPDSAETAFMISGRPRFSPKLFTRFNANEPTRGELQIAEDRGHRHYEFWTNPTGALHIWKMPQRGKRYILGGDPSKGADVNLGVGTPDPDYAVGQIFDANTFEQVAMLRERLTPGAFARYIYDLGQWYKPLYVVIEVETNGGNGAATLIELRQLEYPLHLIHQMQVIDHASQRQTDILGYQISSRTKPQLIANWEKLLYERVVNLHCPITLAEFRTFVYHANGSVGAERGRHDDTVTGCMLAGIGMTQAQGFKEVPVVGPTGEPVMPFVGGSYALTARERAAAAVYGHKPEKRDYEQEALMRQRRKMM